MTKAKNRNIKIQAFTMIELLVVIVLLSILSGVLLTVINPSGVKDTANYAVAEEEMRKFIEAVQIAQSESDRPLKEITGNYCSECACRNVSISLCISPWEQALSKISTTTGGLVDLSELKTDPWGNPYLLDENEYEYSWKPCRPDVISTAGSDGSNDGEVVGEEWYGTAATRSFSIPLYSCRDP